ncbi:molybdopterin-dependent oxidoreductase [Varunaivibrio sulfuroxidans]|uniref:Tetrathionate reductase alpha subunit n=1 Tax=Varunaivibrio sulfuroxidans TaxID=1773489 RepID=A0A4R3J8H7_9PROT|nr:molybdopterin-dependent oxidoreductase [Varunaivibrio sulfuroxidans]TCS61206.1 tetrathionate reductase alpha subunit precursor [Varunaivibrio sulfuroxidans]WES31173.1 molybdopterin-dependent oxidoreductase [Varunaivibrio sulfuroxidans]
MKFSRRNLLKTTVAGGGLAVFAAGYSETGKNLAHGYWAGEKPKDGIYGDAPKPEFSVDQKTGELTVNPEQQVSYTQCLGCTTQCGVRVRIDKKTQTVIRVAGSPFSPLSTDPWLPYETSVRDSFVALSHRNEDGLKYRSTACGRGNAVLEKLTSPFRITTPMKRVGPRNSGKWQPISFEQLVNEIVEGGDLFGEGKVEGLRSLRDLKTPIDPDKPWLGPKANQVGVLDPMNNGRRSLAQRFMKKAFGSMNYAGHGSYCGLAYRAGSGAMFGNNKKNPHAKPDFDNAEFIIFIGTAPSNAGNPFKRQGMQIARARSDGKLDYVVIDPVVSHATTKASADRERWVPIKPGTDGALMMGMIRWIIEHERYDDKFLTQPNLKAAEAAGEVSWSNATHLVIRQEGHPRDGRFLRGSDIGLDIPADAVYGKKDPYVVLDRDSGKMLPHSKATGPARLFFDGELEIKGQKVSVKTSMSILHDNAFQMELADYSKICEVPVDIIAGLASKFTSHGKRAAMNSHGGMMSASGFYNAYSVVMLNTLIGNLNWKGGTLFHGGKYPDAGKGPRYNLATFPGMVKPKGAPITRNKPYEKTGEFNANKAKGNAYPSKHPWYPNSPGLVTEWMTAMFNGDPYPMKALFVLGANPVYGIPGLRGQIADKLADPKQLPLLVSVDPFINETGAYADYIVPDTFMYEAWGWTAPWNDVPTKTTTARWPVMEPRTEKTADGQPITMETFFIAVAKKMNLPGFGEGAITDKAGNAYPLNTAEDYYLRGGANVAYMGNPVPDASDDDIALSGVSRISSVLQKTLKPDEWRKVAYVYARGGRYQNYDERFVGEVARNRFKNQMYVYNEYIGTSRSSMTGKRHNGSPYWSEPVFSDGTPVDKIYPKTEWPFKLISFKSPLQNSYSLGARSLRQIHPENQIIIGAVDAQGLNLQSGDKVRISTPGGSREATVSVRHGVHKGVLAIEHGFGHRELGARPHLIGNKMQPNEPELKAGINLNDLGIPDPTLKGASVFVDPVVGSGVRQGLPAKIERV